MVSFYLLSGPDGIDFVGPFLLMNWTKITIRLGGIDAL
jgi:hypothetical protein